MTRILGDENVVEAQLATMTEGLGKPLIPVDAYSGTGVSGRLVLVFRGEDFSNQIPTGTDAPMQVTFGPAQTTPLGQLNANGSFTLAANGAHYLSGIFPLVRSASGGNSLTFFRFLANGVQAGTLIAVRLNTADVTIPFQFIVELDDTAVAGTVYTIEMLRDSSENNDGSLNSETSALWGAAPSAAIAIYKYT